MKIGGVDPSKLPTEVFLVLPRGHDRKSSSVRGP